LLIFLYFSNSKAKYERRVERESALLIPTSRSDARLTKFNRLPFTKLSLTEPKGVAFHLTGRAHLPRYLSRAKTEKSMPVFGNNRKDNGLTYALILPG
jgi:hypothetical protein